MRYLSTQSIHVILSFQKHLHPFEACIKLYLQSLTLGGDGGGKKKVGDCCCTVINNQALV